MKKRLDAAHPNGTEALTFKFDFELLNFELPNLEFDLSNLDQLLKFDLDSIGVEFDAGNFLTSNRARVLGCYAPKPKNCGARTRRGTLCKCKPIPGKRRCKLHGGASTGPKTPEGRGRIAEAQRRRWAGRP